MKKIRKDLSTWQKPGRALSKIYSPEYPSPLKEYAPIRFEQFYKEYARLSERLAIWEDEGGALKA